MCDEEPRRNCGCRGVKECCSSSECHKRIHICRLMQKGRPCLRIKASPCPTQNERGKSEEEPPDGVVANLIYPRQQPAQHWIKHPHIPTHQWIFHALHAGDTTATHQGHRQQHGEKPSNQTHPSLQA